MVPPPAAPAAFPPPARSALSRLVSRLRFRAAAFLWIVFFDAARGWAHAGSESRGATDTRALYDVGAGILLGDLGIYGAVPLTGSDRGMKFFVRLGPRF